jgi:hypothetical protein
MYKYNTVICVELEVWSRWTTVFYNAVKELEVPKGQSEYIIRSTDNTIAKKGERIIYKTYT